MENKVVTAENESTPEFEFLIWDAEETIHELFQETSVNKLAVRKALENLIAYADNCVAVIDEETVNTNPNGETNVNT